MAESSLCEEDTIAEVYRRQLSQVDSGFSQNGWLSSQTSVMTECEEMPVKKVPLIEQYKLHDHKTRKCVFQSASGDRHHFSGLEKTFLVVGQTGSGKTTLIDGMFNYISGVKWEDPFRYKLTDLVAEEEQKRGDDTISHTEWITVYSLPIINEDIFPYCVNIIDTPGFGDTRGIEFDRKLIMHLTHFFNNHEGRHGVTSIDGICFVAKSPDVRLTPQQEYVLNSIMSIFGKNVKENMFAFATFADGKKPKVYQAFNKAKIPIQDHFKFNNSALFTSNGTSIHDDENDFDLDKKFWDIGKMSFKKFFSRMSQIEPQSTEQTAKMLQDRLELQALLDSINQNITTGCHEMLALIKENSQLKKHQCEMESKQNFKIITTVPEDVEVENKGGTNAMYCNNCKKTCHHPCIKFKIFKYFCPIFNIHGECNICKNRIDADGTKVCTDRDHVLKGTHIETRRKSHETTVEELKKQYMQAKRKTSDQLNIMNEIAKRYKEIKEKVGIQIQQANLSYNRINEIALRDDPMTRVQFINHLMLSEEEQKKDGYLKRIKVLLDFKEMASALENAKQQVNPLESIQNKEELVNFASVCVLYGQGMDSIPEYDEYDN